MSELFVLQKCSNREAVWNNNNNNNNTHWKAVTQVYNNNNNTELVNWLKGSPLSKKDIKLAGTMNFTFPPLSNFFPFSPKFATPPTLFHK